MLSLKKLISDDLPQVFDWNNGEEHGWDYDQWFEQSSRANWVHYGVARGTSLIGSISLELLDPKTTSVHLAFAPDSVKTAELRPLLVSLGISMFDYGIQQLEAAPGQHNGAAAIAQACGFYFMREENGEVIYGMLASDYLSNPVKWDNMKFQAVGH